MRRRDFMGALAAAGLPAAGSAQDARKIYRLAVLAQSSPSVETVRSIVVPELAKHGFVAGVNLVVDLHAGADDELPSLAREIVDRAPDAILTIASQPTRAAQRRTSTIPIVLFGGEDAIAEGFAETLARPGGNVTGVVIMAVQLDGKRLQLLHEAVPSARRVAVLLYRGEPLHKRTAQELHTAATALGLDLQVLSALGRDDFPAAFADMKNSGAQALLIGAYARFFEHRIELARLALAAQLPTICEWASMARDGCLIGYGPDRAALYRSAAIKIARVFQGAAPADLPIEQPALFTFAVNLGTARTLGLDLPPAIVARADEVIE
jgi:putative tryptophan/tyrosine transport system substrate-binding protein